MIPLLLIEFIIGLVCSLHYCLELELKIKSSTCYRKYYYFLLLLLRYYYYYLFIYYYYYSIGALDRYTEVYGGNQQMAQKALAGVIHISYHITVVARHYRQRRRSWLLGRRRRPWGRPAADAGWHQVVGPHTKVVQNTGHRTVPVRLQRSRCRCPCQRSDRVASDQTLHNIQYSFNATVNTPLQKLHIISTCIATNKYNAQDSTVISDWQMVKYYLNTFAPI